MPIPKPNSGESRADFMARCMGDTVMNDDYPDNKQRVAVCMSQWQRHGGKAEKAVSVCGPCVSFMKGLIKAGKVNTGEWSFTAADGNALLGASGDDWTNYEKYHLAEDTAEAENTKARYKYPVGKGGKVYRRGVIAAKSRAAQQGATAVANAADSLLTLIDGKSYGGKSMRHVILKSEDGLLKEQDMSADELEAWFMENSKDGAVLKDITLFTDVQLKSVDGETADWVLSDMTLDRDMERVDPNGGDFKNYKQNPVVLWSHDYTRPAIGKMDNPKVRDGQVVGKVVFDSRENDPFAYMVGQKVKSGIISAGSVGFKPNTVEFVDDAKDPTRMVHRKWELMEFSICNVPSNHNALAQRSIEADGDSPDITLEDLDKRLKELETISAKKTYANILFSEESKPSLPKTETKSAIFDLSEGGKPSHDTTSDAFTQLGESRNEGR